jgi:ATP-dependent DNA helicase RecG
MLAVLGYRQPTGNFKTAIERLLMAGLIERTLPDKPNSRLQKYRLTANGRSVLL